MARFPRTEPDLLEMADRMSTGLEEHPLMFPAPPVSSAVIKKTYEELLEVSHEARAMAAAAKEKYAEKESLLQKMKDQLKANVRYAEVQARHDPKILSLIGWGPRKRKSKARPPGQVQGLEVVTEGSNWVVLSWKKPKGGGAASAFKVRMGISGGDWMLVESTAGTNVRLENLERGVPLSFAVAAMNKAGDGVECTPVTVILDSHSSAIPWVPPRSVGRETE